MNELSSPASVESDNTLGDVIDSYADESNNEDQGSETSGTFMRFLDSVVVLVVGAGIVGLSMAIMLAHQG